MIRGISKFLTSASGSTVSETSVSGNAIISSAPAETILKAAGTSVEEVSENLDALQQFLKDLPGRIVVFGIRMLVAILMLYVGSKLIGLIRKIVKKSMEKAKADIGLAHFLDSVLKVGLYALLVIWIAAYFGFETTSLIAVLGSAGVTIALALQGSLSNVTGGVLLLILKPFKIGDYIIEDSKGNEGFVKEIGLFYTKLRTVDEKTVVLPNGTLANTSLTNVSQTPKRRLILRFGISYKADIKKAKELIKKLVEEDKRFIKGEKVQIYVDSLDESQVTLGLRAIVKNEDYFEVKWDITEAVKEAFDREGVSIPYPQLDVHIDEAGASGGNKRR